MADMADFALEQVCDEEIYRAEAWHAPWNSEIAIEFETEYGYQPQPPLPELDVDVFDPDASLKYATMEFEVLSSTKERTKRNSHSANHQFVELQRKCEKYTKKWQMIYSMAKSVRVYKRTLSQKQLAWMETNYTGGSKKFVTDLNCPYIGAELMWNIAKFSKFVKKFGSGLSFRQAIEQSTQEANDEFPEE